MKPVISKISFLVCIGAMVGVSLIMATMLFAADKTWKITDPAGADWSVAGDWDASGTPTGSDNAYIGNGSYSTAYVNVTQTQTKVSDFYIGNGSGKNGTVTQTSGSLGANNNLYIGNLAGSAGTYSLSGGTFTAQWEYIGNYGSGTFAQSGGTHTISTDLILGRYANSSGTYSLSGSGVLSSTFEYVGQSGAGTFNQSGGTNTVTYLFLGQNTGATGTYTLSGGTLNISELRGNSTSGAGTLTVSGTTAVLNVTGGQWNTDTNKFTFNHGGGTVNFTRSDNEQTIYTNGTGTGQSFYNLTHSGGGTLKFGGNYNIMVEGDLVNSGGTLNIYQRDLYIKGNFTNSATFYYQDLNRVVQFVGDGTTQNLSMGGTGSGKALGNLIHNGSGTLQVTGYNLDIDGSFTNSAGAFSLIDGSTARTMYVGGNWTNAATFVASSGTLMSTVFFDGNSGTKQLNSGGTGDGKHFANLSASNSTLQLVTNDVDVDGNVYSTATLEMNGKNMYIGGNWTTTGNYNSSTTNTVTFDAASGTQTLDTGGTNEDGNRVFKNLTHSGAGTLQLINTDLNVDGNFTNAAGTFDANGKKVYVAGNWTNAGTATFIAGTSSVDLNGTGTHTLDAGGVGDGKYFYNLTTNNGTISLGADVDIHGTFQNRSGFDMNGHNMYISGDFRTDTTVFVSSSGTLTSTVYFDLASGTQTVVTNGTGSDQAQAFYNFVHSGSGTLVFSASDRQLDIKNNFTNQAGTFDISGGNGSVYVGGNWNFLGGALAPGTNKVTFDHGSANIDPSNGGTTGRAFGNVDINTTGTKTLVSNMVVNNTFSIVNGASGTFSVVSGTVSSDMKVGGNWSNPSGIFSAGSGTVEFNGASGTQTVSSGTNNRFYNLQHTGSSTLSWGGTLYVDGNLDTTAGVLSVGHMNIKGNWTNSSAATVINDPYTIVTFNGVNQTVDMGATGATTNRNFKTLTHNGTGTLSIAANDIDIDTAFNNTAGTFDANGHSVYLASNLVNDAPFINSQNAGTMVFNGNTTISGSTNPAFHNVTIAASSTLTGKNAGRIDVAGSWDNTNGNFAHSSGTVAFTGSADSTITTGGDASSKQFYNVIIDSTGTKTLAANNTMKLNSSGVLTITSGTLDIGSNTLSGGTFAALGANGTLRLADATKLSFTILTAPSAAGTWEYTGVANGSGTITIRDFGATDYYNLVIDKLGSSNNTFVLGDDLKVASHLTIDAGTLSLGSKKLIVGGAATSAGDITIGLGGVFSVKGALDVGSATTVVATNGGKVGGLALSGVTTTIGAGGIVSPGGSPGTLVQGPDDMVWQPDGGYEWQIYNATGTAGTLNGWDLITFTGGAELDISALVEPGANKFVIEIQGLSATEPDVLGDPVNFNKDFNYRWKILEGALSHNFSPNYFALEITGFTDVDPLDFSLSYSGGIMYVNYNGLNVPEPATVFGMIAGAFIALYRRFSKRGKAGARL